MQIHELNTFTGSLSATDFFVVDDGTNTTKIALPVITKAEVDTGTDTAGKTVSAQVMSQILAKYASKVTTRIGVSGWSYRKWADGTIEAWTTRTGLAAAGTLWGGGIYAYETTYEIPADVFDGHSPQILTMTSLNPEWWPVRCLISSDLTTLTYKIAKPVADSKGYKVAFYAKYIPNN